MGYAKLWNTIVTSSIWSEPDHVRIMWITLLASADSTGYVSGAIPGLADVARIPLKQAEAALNVLLSPDKYSRSEEFEGRRLDKVDGGYVILNYDKFRATRDPEKHREYMREYMRKRRAKDHTKSKSV